MDFRPMRRAQRGMDEAGTWALLAGTSYGILSLLGDGGYPYGVPLNHVVVEGALYFHAAQAGHKLDALRACPKCCFTVVAGPLDEDITQIPPDSLGWHESAVLFGQLEEVKAGEEVMAVLKALCQRYTPVRLGDEGYFQRYLDKVAILKMRVEHISGKRLEVK